jgi:ubiquinone/menaquinone biosynthesis C-methylase UbiE
MWEDSKTALADLELESRERVLDVGAGTGELTRVLRAETVGEVVALDADRELLDHVALPRALGDATRLPFRTDAFDLVVCQALLVNLPNPVEALEAFARVSRDRVAVIEPDNSAVAIRSSVDGESELAERARARYFDGIDTDVTMGEASDLFAAAGLDVVAVERYDHQRVTEPPYSEQALESIRRKASGAGIDTDRETILAGQTTPEEFDALREQWRSIGREAVEQLQNEQYRRTETIPFYVTVGTVH